MRKVQHQSPWPTAPGVAILTHYKRRWIRGDFLAGCTVAAYLVPQVMAYATIAGLPPVVGLWTMIPCLAVYAVFGSSRQMSVGPESTTALMTAAAVAPLAGGDPVRYAVLSAALALLVGVLCLVCWLIRLGFIADLLSRPVLVGYMAGIAVLMIVGQLGHLTGVPVEGEGFRGQFLTFFQNITDFDPATLLMGIIAVVFLFVVAWRWPALPGPLLAVLIATAAVMAFNLEQYGIDVVGTFSKGLPEHGIPTGADFVQLLFPAIGVLLVGYTDVMLTARAFATRESGNVDANQELFALGSVNISAGLVGGFPVSSSASRTALGITTGAHTQMYSLVSMGWTLAVLFFLSPLLARFPTVVLGAIVVYAATKLVDLGGFATLWAFRRIEFWLAIAALLGVLLLGILNGVILAVALSVAEMLRRVARPHEAVLGFVPGVAGMHDVDDFPMARTIPGLVAFRYDSPLFFANADDFRTSVLAAVTEYEEAGPVYWVLLNMEANVEVDITAMYALESLVNDLDRHHIVLALARVKHDLRKPLDDFGISELIGPERIYPTLPTAVAGYKQWVKEHHR